MGRAARASEVERAFRPWPTTPRPGGAARRARITIEGPPRTERHPLSALRRGGVHVSTEVRRASSSAADPASGTGLRPAARVGIDGSAGAREKSVGYHGSRKTHLPRDAVRVERPLPNGRGSVTSQAHHAGRRGRSLQATRVRGKPALRRFEQDRRGGGPVSGFATRGARFEREATRVSCRVRSKPAGAQGVLARRGPAKFDASRTTGVWRREEGALASAPTRDMGCQRHRRVVGLPQPMRRRRSAANASRANKAHDTCRASPEQLPKSAAAKNRGARG